MPLCDCDLPPKWYRERKGHEGKHTMIKIASAGEPAWRKCDMYKCPRCGKIKSVSKKCIKEARLEQKTPIKVTKVKRA